VTEEQEAWLAQQAQEVADAGPMIYAPAKGRLENVTVVKADGRVFDLGRPGTAKFRRRHRRYLKEAVNG